MGVVRRSRSRRSGRVCATLFFAGRTGNFHRLSFTEGGGIEADDLFVAGESGGDFDFACDFKTGDDGLADEFSIRGNEPAGGLSGDGHEGGFGENEDSLAFGDFESGDGVESGAELQVGIGEIDFGAKSAGGIIEYPGGAGDFRLEGFASKGVDNDHGLGIGLDMNGIDFGDIDDDADGLRIDDGEEGGLVSR